MAKRSHEDADDGEAAFRKRQRITTTAEVTSGEKIEDADHLRKLLSFDQDLGRAKHGDLQNAIPSVSKLMINSTSIVQDTARRHQRER